MIKLYKNRIFAVITIFVIALITLFFIAEKSNLTYHNHCEDEECPICEIIYIINSELKNLSSGNEALKIFLCTIVALIKLCAEYKNVFAKELSLIQNKVRLND